jgi:hypothetical protein
MKDIGTINLIDTHTERRQQSDKFPIRICKHLIY